jgi:hypothetical protein
MGTIVDLENSRIPMIDYQLRPKNFQYPIATWFRLPIVAKNQKLADY